MLLYTFKEPFLFVEPHLFILYFNIVPFAALFTFPFILYSYKKQKLTKFTSFLLLVITNLFLYLVFDAVYNEFNRWETDRIIIWVVCNNLFPIVTSVVLIKRKNRYLKMEQQNTATEVS